MGKTPSNELDVSGHAKISEELTIGNKLLLEDGCNIVRKLGPAFYINHQSDKPIVFKQAGNERIRINSGGNVGIGVTDPSKELDVSGDGIQW